MKLNDPSDVTPSQLAIATRLEIAKQVDQVCDQYENAWRAGTRPQIEQYLSDTPELERSRFFQALLAVELEFRRLYGETPRPDEYYQRFPEHVQLIDEEFSGGRANGESRSNLGNYDDLDPTPLKGLRQDDGDMPRLFGETEVVREIGRGGMGIVFEGHDRALEKRVAIKVLPLASRLDNRGRTRFRNEARAAGQLEHPHIVPVYSIGVEQGVDYYVMQYIEGCNLAQLIRALRRSAVIEVTNETPSSSHNTSTAIKPTGKSTVSADDSTDTARFSEILSTHRSNSDLKYFRFVAQLVIDVANALKHAHGMGVTHRDIKPSNLLLDTNHHIWVADFGLAQIQGEPELTFTGNFVGTLRYLSPEQAHAKRIIVDHRTDIYSLGVTVYELLTLRVAFNGETKEEVLRQIAFEDPPAPRKINRRVPQDMETIVMKAMSKRPDDRYQTAEELADDLQRFLDDVPIRAKPPTIVQRITKWGRRHRTAVISILAIWLILFAGTLSAALVVWNQKQQLQVSLTENQAQELVLRSNLELVRNPTKSLALASAAAQLVTNVAVNNALHAAIMSLHERKTLKHNHGVATCRFSPDGRLLVTTAARWPVKDPRPTLIWDVESGSVLATIRGEQSLTSAVFSPDNRHILGASSSPTAESSTGEELAAVGSPPTLWKASEDGNWPASPSFVFAECFLFDAHSSIFHPDGKRLILPGKGGMARIFEAGNGQEIRKLPHADQRVIYAAFSPDGRHIATVSENKVHQPTLRVWESESRSLLSTIALPGSGEFGANKIRSVRFHPRRDVILTGSSDRGIELWDVRTSNKLNRGYWHGDQAHFDGSGAKVIGGTRYGNKIEIRDTGTGHLLASLSVEGGVGSLIVSPGAQFLAAFSINMEVHIWDLSSLKLISVLRGHTGALTDGDFRFGDVQLTSSSADTTVRLWDVFSRKDRLTIETPSSNRGPIVEASQDSTQLLAVAPSTDRVAIWDVETRKETTVLPGHTTRTTIGKEICLTDKLCLTVSGNRVDAWDSVNGQSVSSLELPGIDIATMGQMVFSDASGWAAIGISHENLVLWNPHDNIRRFLSGNDATITALEFTPDGKFIASGSTDGVVRLWSIPSGEMIREFVYDATIFDIAFSPAGDRIVITTGLNSATICRRTDGRVVTSIPSGLRKFTQARFSHDGKHLITWDTSIAKPAVWDAATGTFLRALEQFTGAARIAIHKQSDLVAIASLGDEKGSSGGGAVWNYISGQIQLLTQVPLRDIAFLPGEHERVIAATNGHIGNPAYYPPDQAVPRHGSSKLVCWNAGNVELEFSIELDRAVQRIHDLREPSRLAILYSDYGYAAYAREENDRQYTAYGHRGPISALAFTPAPNSQIVTAGYDGKLITWDRATGKRRRMISVHSAPVMDVDVNPASRQEIASASADGTVRTWSAENNEGTIQVPSGYGQAWFVKFSATGKQLLSVHRAGTVAVCDLTANKHQVLRSRDHAYNRADYSSSGKWLLVAEGAKYVVTNRGFQPSANKPPYFVRIYSSAALDRAAQIELPHDAPVLFAQFDPKEELVLTVTSAGELTLWETAQGRKLRRVGLAEQVVTYAEFSPNSEFIYAEFSDYTSPSAYGQLFRTLEVAPVLEFSVIQNQRGRFPWGPIAPAFTPDSKWIVLGIDGQHMLRAPTRVSEFARQVQPIPVASAN